LILDERVPAPILVVSGPSGAGKTTVAKLIASSFEKSAHIAIDEFLRFIASGWVDPRLPTAASQNVVVGVSVAASAIQFARGGYTVVVDGHLFPDGAEGMSSICRASGIGLHFAVLRPDLATCEERAAQRPPGTGRFRTDATSVRELYSRFTRLGAYEANVIDSSSSPADAAEAVLAAFHCGRLELQT